MMKALLNTVMVLSMMISAPVTARQYLPNVPGCPRVPPVTSSMPIEQYRAIIQARARCIQEKRKASSSSQRGGTCTRKASGGYSGSCAIAR